MDEFGSVLSQLVSSRQQVDTLEKEVEARSRENLLLRQQLQELTDFAGGLTVRMPRDWSLEEQNTALRLAVRTAMENLTGEGMFKQLELGGKDLPSLVRKLMAENEEQGREMRRLERRITELDINREGLEKKEDESEAVTNGDIMKTDRSVDTIEKEVDSLEPRCDIVLGSSDGEEQFARMSDLHDVSIKMELSKNQDEISTEVKPVTSSRAKLKSKHCSPLPPLTPSVPHLPISQLTDEEFCDLQIRLLEAGHELSKEDQQVVEEMTNKFSDTEGLEVDRLAEEEMILQPCQVMLTGLGWGPSPGAVVRHVREYEGVTKVRVEGDIAMVQFINLDWAEKFRGDGGQHLVEGCRLEVGEIVIVEEVENNIDIIDKNIESDGVGEEIVSSVAVRVRRRGVRQ